MLGSEPQLLNPYPGHFADWATLASKTQFVHNLFSFLWTNIASINFHSGQAFWAFILVLDQGHLISGQHQSFALYNACYLSSLKLFWFSVGMFTCININHMCSFVWISHCVMADHTFFHVQDVTGWIVADWPYLYIVYPIVLLSLLFYYYRWSVL